MNPKKINKQDDLLKIVKESGKVVIVIEDTPGNWYRFQNALGAFLALNDCLWGDFYQNNLKHGGDLAKWKTPEEALWAYRDFIAEVLKKHDLDIDRGTDI